MSRTLAKGVTTEQPKLHTITLNVYTEDGDYVVDCVEFGTVGQGSNLEEAIQDWSEATQIYLGHHPNLEAAFAPRPHDSLIDGVREIERAYSRRLGEEVEPSDVRLVKTLTLPFYA
jgi:predicted RNase H-like HicB family nuclease